MSVLAVDDYVGISFFITSMALLAASIFFYMERSNQKRKWQLSMTVMVLVTFIAFVHYLYMRSLWIDLGESPISYRYIDWFITVPLQIVEFYLILSVGSHVSPWVFWRLLLASVLMLVFGYIGEAGLGDTMFYFTLGTASWLFILFEVFFGPASQRYDTLANESVRLAFSCLRLIVTIGWAIYPIGYLYGYADAQPNIDVLNLIYNFADFVNKIAFGLVIWYAATLDSGNLESEL